MLLEEEGIHERHEIAWARQGQGESCNSILDTDVLEVSLSGSQIGGCKAA